MTGNYISQLDILGSLGEVEIGHKRSAREQVWIFLTDVIHRVDEWQHVGARHTHTAHGTLLKLQVHACQIALLCPCVNKHAHISLILKLWIQAGDVLSPLHAVGPFGYVDRPPLCRQLIVLATIIANAEGCHESHQLYRGKIILACDNANKLLIFSGVYGRETVLALSYCHEVDGRLLWQDKHRARLVPTVTIGSHRGLYIHPRVALIMRHVDFLQDDSPIHKANDSVCVGGIVVGKLRRHETHVCLFKDLYDRIALGGILLVVCGKRRDGTQNGK